MEVTDSDKNEFRARQSCLKPFLISFGFSSFKMYFLLQGDGKEKAKGYPASFD